ncbi:MULTISPECIES: hypothetical protein [unclassified Bacillus (in: firmicutes)]|uniref:hypothetical protein n=1 Tax=unclassified Bacillus (in: firmicutes) TaxID=185979 RepID=UPI000C784F8F|nr:MULTISPECIES: hypothetical protein [unclassified Bacillus (in: firmicutes)]MDT0160339.1 hypothetical protein [Bacillus sp. AG4(2022)]PLR72266.1 hypothetical protein CYJ37_11970 [Bacillus sp. UMB0728]
MEQTKGRDFKNLNVVQEVQYNNILDKNKEREMRLKPITEYLSKHYTVEEITEMNDYQIAKVKRKDIAAEWLYPTFINYKPLHEMAMTFDQAVLICLSYKYDNRRTDAVTYISRILNVNFNPEEIE